MYRLEPPSPKKGGIYIPESRLAKPGSSDNRISSINFSEQITRSDKFEERFKDVQWQVPKKHYRISKTEESSHRRYDYSSTRRSYHKRPHRELRTPVIYSRFELDVFSYDSLVTGKSVSSLFVEECSCPLSVLGHRLLACLLQPELVQTL
ncbi:hypothetical protein GJ496_003958 [Pomphorhynchus laevis]|nr:hypothetical protein GJ496_003958 [Pomphorhynchus laevis]